MIFIPYYASNSLDNLEGKQNIRPMKLAEMIIVLYYSIRFFCGENIPIFILDNASPIPISNYLTNFNEKFIILNSNNYFYNEKVNLYIKRFNVHENNFYYGWERRVIEFYKYAYLNNLDCCVCDMDVFVSFCFTNDCIGYDFVCHGFLDYETRVVSSFIYFISKKRLHDKDKYFNLIEWINYVKNNFDINLRYMSIIAEGSIYNNFCYGKTKVFSYPSALLHNSDKKTLYKSLCSYKSNGFDKNFVNDFANKIKNNNSLE